MGTLFQMKLYTISQSTMVVMLAEIINFMAI